MGKQPFEERFWAKVDKSGECWLWTSSRKPNGYGEFMVQGDRLAHRIAYRLVNGEIPERAIVGHRCNVKHCVRPAHLYLTDSKGNAADAARDGLYERGEVHRATHGHAYFAHGTGHPLARFRDEDILMIRRLAAAGTKQRDIAALYGVSQGTIGFIVRRETWTHL